MITTTHLAIGAVAARWSRVGEGRLAASLGPLVTGRLGRTMLVLGSGLPDLPLLGALVVAVVGAVVGGTSPGDAVAETLTSGFEASRPLVLAHVALHAPLVQLGLLALALGLTRAGAERPHTIALRGLATGLLLHTAIDLLTHADDGPLLLWPFSWSVQFRSPLAWSVADAHGPWLLTLDLVAGLALLAWLTASRRRVRRWDLAKR